MRKEDLADAERWLANAAALQWPAQVIRDELVRLRRRVAEFERLRRRAPLPAHR